MNPRVNSVERASKRIKRAWLITWERASHRFTTRKRFVALIGSRFSGSTVKSILKQYYVSEYLSLPEQLSYIKSKRCLYEVQLTTIAISEELQKVASLPASAPFSESMIIGGNPWLWARMVYDIQSWTDENNQEHLKWKERENLLWHGDKITSVWREDSLVRCD
jgi:hypothetical protein